MLPRIPLSYNALDIPRLTEVLKKYEHVHHNQMITDFEKLLVQKTGSGHAVALNSGTAAIHLALRLMGVQQGDTVVVPTFTYIGSANPLNYLGAQPVFVDSEPKTWNMDPNLLEKALMELDQKGSRPKAILVVHTYGMPSAMDDILSLANRYEIPVMEDAAESLGALYRNKTVGTLGDVGIYSFNNNKTVTTYGGGALITKNAEWAQKTKFLATQAREALPYYEHRESGYNYAMSPLNAACGLSQLPLLEDYNTIRRNIFSRYRESLNGTGVTFQEENPDMKSNRWFSACLFENELQLTQVEQSLKIANIETRPVWKPLHLQPVFTGALAYINGTAENLFKRGRCLPSGNDLSQADQQAIIKIVNETLTGVTKY